MPDFNYITKEDIKQHDANWPQIPDHPWRIFIVEDSRSGKTNALLNLIISQQPDIGKTYWYVKMPMKQNTNC